MSTESTDLETAVRKWERRRALLAILGLALVLRGGWGLSQPATDVAIDRLPDQREYLQLARNLLAGQGLQFDDPRFIETVYAFRTPGYPAFVALFGANVRLVRLGQAVVDTSTVLAVYLLARALLSPALGRRGPLAAALVVAVNPFLIYLSGLILSETLFTAMLAWGMLLLVVGGWGARLRLSEDVPELDVDTDTPREHRPPRRGLGTILWLAGGLLLAGSALVRPSAIPLPVLLGIAAAFVNRPPRRRQNRGRGAAYEAYPSANAPLYRWPLPVGTTMLLLTVLVLLPWAARNRRVLGEWVWTTTNEGVTLYDGFNPDATGGSDQSFLRGMPYLRDMGEVGRSQYLNGLARQYIRQNPKRSAGLAVAKAGRTWSPVPLSAEFGGVRNRVIALLYSVPFDLLVLAGLFGRGARPAAKVFVLLPAIYFTAVHMMSVGSLRYRIPVEPPMAVLAAAALAWMLTRNPMPWRLSSGETP